MTSEAKLPLATSAIYLQSLQGVGASGDQGTKPKDHCDVTYIPSYNLSTSSDWIDTNVPSAHYPSNAFPKLLCWQH
jgi:hypothetical protein